MSFSFINVLTHTILSIFSLSEIVLIIISASFITEVVNWFAGIIFVISKSGNSLFNLLATS